MELVDTPVSEAGARTGREGSTPSWATVEMAAPRNGTGGSDRGGREQRPRAVSGSQSRLRAGCREACGFYSHRGHSAPTNGAKVGAVVQAEDARLARGRSGCNSPRVHSA